MLNYKMVQNLPDPGEALVTIQMVFTEINHDIIPIVSEDVI